MSGTQPGTKCQGGQSGRLGLFLIILSAVLLGLFHESLEPNHYLFANDAPLGAMMAADNAFPDVFTGRWMDLNWVGFEIPSAAPNISGVVATVLSPELCFKVFAPLSLLILGFSVWLFFRQLRFGPMVCVIGGVAAGLNMHFLSIACWGLGTWTLASASMFFALAAMVSPSIRQTWARAALAGFGVGLGVVEGFDIGAILSIFCGVFVLFTVWVDEGGIARKILRSLWVPGLVVLFSMFAAAHTVSSLIDTQIKGITGVKQDAVAKGSGWNFATQWSLPKLEAFRVFIPGVFGYRLDVYIHDSDRSSSYWGRVGEDPNIPLLDSRNPAALREVCSNLGLRTDFANALTGNNAAMREQAISLLKANLQKRHSGSGEYAGVLVSILAIFGLANGLRRDKAVFSTQERRAIWFWGIVALISLLLAFGRHAFLYQYMYQLPYFSTIRNPVKFMYPFHIAWIILAGYGMEALHRHYLKESAASALGLFEQLKAWLGRMAGFDKKWAWGSFLALAASGFTILIVISSRADIERYLQAAGFPQNPASASSLSASSAQVASFCFGELFWFFVYAAISLAIVVGIMSGAFNGRRIKWAWLCLGLVMVLDLSRSDWRWIGYYDFNQRYATNPVLEQLKNKPYEHRVTAELMPMTRQALTTTPNFFSAYYDILQNQIPFLNIQTLDIIQMPRTPEFDKAYIDAFRPTTSLFPCLRLWQLTNTRYILGSTNNNLALRFSREDGFEPRVLFNVVDKPGVTQLYAPEDLTFEETTNGPMALYELTNVLPRAKLFANWKAASTNEAETLALLASPRFDPLQTVIVAAETPVASPPADASPDAGTVTIDTYKPKRIQLTALAKTGSVLLLNDHTAPQWHVWVDGAPANILRLNYIMRGVYLTQGQHKVEFRFQPSLTTLYVSLGAWGTGVLIGGFVFVSNRSRRKTTAPGAAA